MLISAWLCTLRQFESHLDRLRPDRPTGRRDPWRHAGTAYRSNPFVPPVRVRASRLTRLRRTELRRVVRQRQD